MLMSAWTFTLWIEFTVKVFSDVNLLLLLTKLFHCYPFKADRSVMRNLTTHRTVIAGAGLYYQVRSSPNMHTLIRKGAEPPQYLSSF